MPFKIKETNEELIGQRFGQRVIVSYSHTNKHRVRYFNVVCDCGYEHITRVSELRKYPRCKFCAQRDRVYEKQSSFEHYELLYKRWENIKTRCNNPKHISYNDYGNRGVSMCKEWEDNYLCFEKWSIENGFKPELTLDRIDVNGKYEPNNCRWVNWYIQANNKRNNILIKYLGRTQTQSQWCREFNINPATLYPLMKKHNISNQEAFIMKVEGEVR